MKSVIVGVLVACVLALGIVVLFRRSGQGGVAVTDEAASNVALIDGTQVVTIKVKGGYQPGTSTVKAGVPTVLRFETKGTFDCSSIIRIPSLGIQQNLPATGSTDVAVGALKVGKLQGSCGMGMYYFSVDAKG